MQWTGHTSGTIGKYVGKGANNKDRLMEVFKI
jgi:hypothetical protein